MFTDAEFCAKFPYLYHLTSAHNLPRIQARRLLESANSIFGSAHRQDLIGKRREEHEKVALDGHVVWIRDQAPLHQGNIEFEDGWTIERFITHLNDRVFFWPGDKQGPIKYGLRHLRRYLDEGPTFIRVYSQRLFCQNPYNPAMFCRYNSGSPRCSNGKKSPRGSATFRTGEEVDFQPKDVVEVTFRRNIILPDDAEFLRVIPWNQMFEAAAEQPPRG